LTITENKNKQKTLCMKQWRPCLCQNKLVWCEYHRVSSLLHFGR